MRDADGSLASRIGLYLTAPHGCSYLDGRTAQTLFVDPRADCDPYFYERLLMSGFRRSGNHVYRPQCPACDSCVPVRIPVADIRLRRGQRRCWRRNHQRVRAVPKAATFDTEHYALYLRYASGRHGEGGMANADPEQYLAFLTTRWCDTQFIEFRRDDQLMAVAVTDLLPGSLSAVYTFFDPQMGLYSPGVYAILWQIEEARRRGLEFLYLGYWIAETEKMRYKDQYRPLEAWDGSRWRRFASGQTVMGRTWEGPLAPEEARG